MSLPRLLLIPRLKRIASMLLKLPTIPSLQIFALIVIAILSLFGCAATPPPCERHQPLNDPPAPPPQIFSRCLREIIAVGKLEQVQISSECSTLLQGEPTK
jgi:hypothetical protein